MNFFSSISGTIFIAKFEKRMCDCGGKATKGGGGVGISKLKDTKEGGTGEGLLPQQKLVLLGSSGVGKTNIGKRLLNEDFSPISETTVGAAYSTRAYKLKNGQLLSLAIWDTAGFF